MITLNEHKKLVAGAAAVLCLILAMAPVASAPVDTWTVMAYLDATGDLQPAAQYYLKQLIAVAPQPSLRVLVQVKVPQDTAPGPVAVRYFYDELGTSRRQRIGGTAADNGVRLADFVSWAFRQAPARHYALLIMGHGQPLTPPMSGGPAAPTSDEPLLSGEYLAKALTEAGCRREASVIDVLFLDCCYGATVEVVGELREVAHYLVGSPGLMYSPGLPWAQILPDLQQSSPTTARQLAAVAVRKTGEFWRNEIDLPIALVAVDLQRADSLVQRLGNLSESAVSRMPAIAADIAWARSRTMAWASDRSIVDLAGFANVLAEVTTDHVLAHDAWQLAQAVREATVASHIQGAYGGGKARGAGLGIFFPLVLKTDQFPPTHTRSIQMNERTGWGLFLQSYMNQLQQLVTTEGRGSVSES